ncbi:hypothetical protein Pla8534_14400 [Lignipirellula cremea]|uniref:Uncharacterized protein n=1 Tax=Lignipirellula cremea TaxID=2528010 RepID=A0A518DP92_9BACT|nr:hypothetical protein Pla8534_14400 [Lignipirellula cremea]
MRSFNIAITTNCVNVDRQDRTNVAGMFALRAGNLSKRLYAVSGWEPSRPQSTSSRLMACSHGVLPASQHLPAHAGQACYGSAGFAWTAAEVVSRSIA